MNRESFPDAILRPHGFFAARRSAPEVDPLKLLASWPSRVLESKVEALEDRLPAGRGTCGRTAAPEHLAETGRDGEVTRSRRGVGCVRGGKDDNQGAHSG